MSKRTSKQLDSEVMQALIIVQADELLEKADLQAFNSHEWSDWGKKIIEIIDAWTADIESKGEKIDEQFGICVWSRLVKIMRARYEEQMITA